jgi:hypothetical protein
LGVVVGVGVDDPRGHHQALGVELGGRLLGELADGHDLAVTDPDVGLPGRSAGAVDNQAVADGVIEHGTVPLCRHSALGRSASVPPIGWTPSKSD